MEHLLNPNQTVTTITSPYPAWIIDNTLDTSVVHALNAEWPNETDPRWFHGYETVGGNKNILEGKRRAISTWENLTPIAHQIFSMFHSDKFTEWLSALTGIPSLLTDTTFRWSGMRVMPAGSWQLIHSDARKHPENNLRKELTVLYYLNEGYDRVRDEGCLELWNDTMTERVTQIEPIGNRMVVFQCTDTSYHGVPLVTGERRFLTFSVMKDGPASDYPRARFVARPEDPSDVNTIGEKRSGLML